MRIIGENRAILRALTIPEGNDQKKERNGRRRHGATEELLVIA